MAISKAIKTGRLEYHAGSKSIDVDHPLSKAFLNNISPQRLRKTTEPIDGVLQIPHTAQQDSYVPENAEDIANAVEKYSKHRAEKEKQAAIKLKMQNAVTRSDLFESGLVENELFLYLDRVHSDLDRLSGATLEDVVRLAIIAGKLLPEHKLKWKNACKSAVHNAKMEIVERLEGIKEVQAKS